MTDDEMDQRLRAATRRSWTPEPVLSATDRQFNDALTEANKGSKASRLARELLSRD